MTVIDSEADGKKMRMCVREREQYSAGICGGACHHRSDRAGAI